MSFFRRAGAEIAKFIELAADPAAIANRILLYSKDVAGVTELFARASDGTISQLTPITAGVALNVANTWTKSQNVARVALADGATINTDASLGNVFSVTLGGNRTLANPTNLVDGGIYTWIISQDGTGSRTLAYGALFKWTGGTPVLSTVINSIDTITAIYNGTVLLASCQKAYT